MPFRTTHKPSGTVAVYPASPGNHPARPRTSEGGPAGSYPAHASHPGVSPARVVIKPVAGVAGETHIPSGHPGGHVIVIPPGPAVHEIVLPRDHLGAVVKVGPQQGVTHSQPGGPVAGPLSEASSDGWRPAFLARAPRKLRRLPGIVQL